MNAMNSADSAAGLRRTTQFVPVLVFFGAAATFSYLWLLSTAPWMHPELAATARHVWENKNATLGEKLVTVFNWKTFDPNINRVRPLNDLGEIIDHTSRPYLVPLVGAHPSLTPLALLTALGCPLLFFFFLRRYLGDWRLALILTALFLSSSGYMSTIIPCIRPAKKLALLSLCLILFLGVCYEQRRQAWLLCCLWASLLASFFTDEISLANFAICGILFHRALLVEATWLRRAAFLALPAVFLAFVKWGLPALYLKYGVHGAWNALGDPGKVRLLGYLVEPDFIHAAMAGLSRSIQSTVGISKHAAAADIGVCVLVLILFASLWALCRRLQTPETLAAVRRLELATLLMVVNSGYATLLDWHPFPHEISYMGSYNYYYHCTISVFVILWLGTLWGALWALCQQYRGAALVPSFATAGLVLVVALNFVLFQHINALLQIIHTYPYAATSLHRVLREHAGQPALEQPTRIGFVEERGLLKTEFIRHARAGLGRDWRTSRFAELFTQDEQNSIWRREELEYLTIAYFPLEAIVVEVRESASGARRGQ